MYIRNEKVPNKVAAYLRLFLYNSPKGEIHNQCMLKFLQPISTAKIVIVYHFANILSDNLEFYSMDALERSKRYIEVVSIIMQEEGMTKDADLASVVGVERSIIPKVRTGKQYASIELIVKTFIAYPKINTDYILTGRGSMFNQEQGEPPSKQESKNEAKFINGEMVIQVPLVNQYAYAGYLSGYQTDTYIDSLPTIPFIADHEMTGKYIAFEVKGDSMNDGTEDSYLEGDRLLCREIPQYLWADSRLHIKKWDFVIVHEEGILIKRIIEHDVNNHTIKVRSLNDFYPDKTLDLSEVRQIFKVVEMQRKRRR